MTENLTIKPSLVTVIDRHQSLLDTRLVLTALAKSCIKLMKALADISVSNAPIYLLVPRCAYKKIKSEHAFKEVDAERQLIFHRVETCQLGCE
jgi:hypothetical protein